MSRSALRALISVGSVSIAFAIAAVSLPFLGCSSFYDDFSTLSGACEDDGNPCTIDKCPTAVTVHENAPMGTLCAIGDNAGKCDGEGTCIRDCDSDPSSCKCQDDGGCPSATECAAWKCSGGVCVAMPQNVGLPISQQTADDCKVVVCAEDGSTRTENDDTDVVMAPNNCPLRQCMNGVVIEKQCNGAPCTMGTECESGFCADGVCCVSDCTETCKSCAVPNNLGKCEFIPLYKSDESFISDITGMVDNCTTASGFSCNGAGKCLKLGGAGCSTGGECVSGLCKQLMAGMFCRGVAGEPCDANSDCDLNMCVDGFCK